METLRQRFWLGAGVEPVPILQGLRQQGELGNGGGEGGVEVGDVAEGAGRLNRNSLSDMYRFQQLIP